MRFLLPGLILAGICAATPVSDSALLNPPPHSQWGYSLTDTKTGEILAESNAHQFLVPASVVKMLTTAFVLEKLGADQRFPTTLYKTGKIKNGVLHGDLWIRGGGNPAFGSDRGDSSQRMEAVFKLFTLAVGRSGISKISGNIHGDASLLESEGPSRGALWEDVGNYYGTVPSGLCFHDNSYTLRLNTANNQSLIVEENTRPKHIGISRFQITARNSGALNGDSCFILGAFWNAPRLIVGKCPVGKQPLEIKGSLPDPAWTCARSFEDFLRTQGIAVKGSSVGRTEDPLPKAADLPQDTFPLAEHVSPPLIDLIALVHSFSDNLYASQLLALAGGLPALQNWLETQGFDDINSEMRLVDGNGLSLQNQLTTTALNQLLSEFANKPWFPAWRETLLGGNARPFRSTAYAEGLHGKLWVKTGSMNSVSSLSGYLLAKSGRLLSFTIILNHFDERSSTLRNGWGPLLGAWQERY